MRKHNDEDLKPGDKVAFYTGYDWDLQTEQTVVQSNPKYITLNNGRKFSQSNWVAYGQTGKINASHIERWDQIKFSQDKASREEYTRRFSTIGKLEKTDWRMLRNTNILVEILTMYETALLRQQEQDEQRELEYQAKQQLDHR